MFANCQLGGLDLGFPDVCLTPAPPAPAPVPMPYPNFGAGPIGVPAAYTILYDCGPAHNLETEVPITMGDTPGLAGGVMSATDMGPARPMTGAFTVLLNGMPATRLTSLSIGNTTNCPTDMRIVPSQVTVLLLAP